MSFRAQRRFLSTNVETYEKILLKKFLLQVHPDFFHQFKPEQAVNATNIPLLRAPGPQPNIDGSTSSREQFKPRSLIFYLKPAENTSKPRRVKVTLARLTESIRDILETLGVELPSKPEGVGAPIGFMCSITEEDFFAFLDTLVDR